MPTQAIMETKTDCRRHDHLLRWLDPAYFGENLYFYIFVFLLFIWSHGEHSS